MNILIADDHPLYREAMRMLLKQLDAEATISEAGEFGEVMTMVTELDLDLLLLDLQMPGMDGLAAIRELRLLVPSVPVVVVSASDRAQDARQAIGCGASGYIPKGSNSRIILNALRLVMSGGTYVPPMMLDLIDGRPNGEPLRTSNIRPARRAAVSLTPRQRDVLALIAEGKSNKEIARTLNLAVPTVKLHVTAIFAALGVSNRTEAAIAAGEFGLSLESEET